MTYKITYKTVLKLVVCYGLYPDHFMHVVSTLCWLAIGMVCNVPEKLIVQGLFLDESRIIGNILTAVLPQWLFVIGVIELYYFIKSKRAKHA